MKSFFDYDDQILIAAGAHPGLNHWREESFGSDPDLIFGPLPEPKVEDFCKSCQGLIDLHQLIQSAKVSRKITKAFAHCTGTRANAKVESIIRYWKQNLGWKSPGYHIIVDQEGKWTYLQDFNVPSNGVLGHNTTSVHISYIGGLNSSGRDEDTRTAAQIEVMEAFFVGWKKRIPTIQIFGHKDMAKKACPCFDAKNEYKNL